MKNSCYLPIAYWGPIQYFTKFLLYDKIFIEQYETYSKQTYRNRCNIYGPNGVQSLNVPVIKGSSKNILTKDITISYDMNWKINHLRSLESAYNSSPFYEFYIDDILQLYKKKYDTLIDFNLDILRLCFEWLQIDDDINLTTDFNLVVQGDDYRQNMHPKENRNEFDGLFKQANYIQGFEQRSGFIPNLSILDLIFNTGPEARIVVLNSYVE